MLDLKKWVNAETQRKKRDAERERGFRAEDAEIAGTRAVGAVICSNR
jgi:hypothetical protein